MHVLDVVALIGLALHFAGAVAFHVRVGDGIDQFGIPLAVGSVMTLAAIVRAVTI